MIRPRFYYNLHTVLSPSRAPCLRGHWATRWSPEFAFFKVKSITQRMHEKLIENTIITMLATFALMLDLVHTGNSELDADKETDAAREICKVGDSALKKPDRK
ncbi:hypothetical protein M405DRAFT_638056 [Rhizopogon salebrosus TDB-379]|nr:hypothetical protein M405DRAFT_638056 [Rhizopogon salebrosus TDB-379]